MRTTPGRPDSFAAFADPSTPHLAALIMSAYREMPGLNLNLQQVARMFACPELTCGEALNGLVNAGLLRKLATGAYAKA